MKFLYVLILFLINTLFALAQVTGRVIDSKTRQPLDYVSVYYEGKSVGEQTDEEGRFVLKEDSAWRELTVSSLGYITQVIRLGEFGHNKNMDIRLVPEARLLQGVTVKAKRTRYSRKNNPAVELMRNVIKHKKMTDLRQKDYFSYQKYEKMTFSLNEFTEKVLEDGEFKKFAFLKDHVERCPQTGKLILPVIVQEHVSDIFYRRSPHSEKQLIKASNDKGVNELINTGEIITTMLKDVFTDVDIYENECRLLQYPFKSPIADNAISFYRYYLQDTIQIEQDSVIDVGFLPNNQQDFGFSGHVYIMKDSTYAVRRVELNIPRRSDVNFVENMIIRQDLDVLPTGERVVLENDMLVELKLASWIQKLMVQRTIRHFDYAFTPIPDRVFKSIKGDTKTEPDAKMKGEEYWAQFRQVELTESESKMGSFMEKLQNVKGFKWFMFGLKALIENFIETASSTDKNKFDFGPINTIISSNDYDSWRFRISGFTTAHWNPHFFLDGYVAYGTQTRNWYGMLKATYSFNKKAYLHREFPKNNLQFEYYNDITSPYTKFMTTDKDNMFMAFKASKVDQFYHTRTHKLMYDREWEDGMKFYIHFDNTRNEAVDQLFFQHLGTQASAAAVSSATALSAAAATPQPTNDPRFWDNNMTTTEVKATLTFEPGATYINTKQRRLKINLDAPIFTVSHTWGIKGLLGGQYNYHVTEAGIYKRFWVGSWGKIDCDLKAGAQWSKVPYPLLIHPVANDTYILQDYNFNLINIWEFLNDRYASLMVSWDMNGKILNRIPLIRKLKWREWIGVNVLWGTLTDKNNPAASGYTDPDLFFFPGRFNAEGQYESNTYVMSPRKPYIEAVVGVHNIFKLFHVVYVRRLTYLDHPGINRNGVRFIFRMTF